MALRYLADAGAQWLRLLRTVLTRALRLGWRSLCLVILPVAAATAGAAASWTAAGAQREYLVEGGLPDAGAAVLWCVLSLLAAAVVWSVWSGLPAVRAMISSAYTVGDVVAVALGCQAVGGWLLGVTGMLGYGSIRVGWFTGGATVLFAVFFLWSMLRRGDSAGISVSRPA